MPERQLTASSAVSGDRVRATLQEMFAEFFDLDTSAVSLQATFLEMGADSLFLLDASQKLQTRFGVNIPFRNLIEGLSTIDALADFIAQTAPPAVEPLAPGFDRRASDDAIEGDSEFAISDDEPEASYEINDATEDDTLEGVFSKQLEVMNRQFDIMTRQLNLLRSDESGGPVRLAIEAAARGLSPRLGEAAGRVRERKEKLSAEPAHSGEGQSNAGSQRNAGSQLPFQPKRFTAFEQIPSMASNGLTARQQKHLDALIYRINRRTRESKRLAQVYRPVLADSRFTAAYNHLWKEMIYQVRAQRAAGSRIWDVDGNEYVDIAMGFGSLLFGHSPAFLIKAIEEQIGRGMQIGMESNSAGQVAELICELTGAERAAFCNSGTEAIMSALRLARAATGRSRVALFTGSYHGTFDPVMVRGRKGPDGRLRAVPLAPGVPASMMQEVVALNYCDPDCFAILKEHSSQLAAVLVEPKQSRRPDMQADEFLRGLRDFTEEAGIPLIFDEVVTGFRMHPGGIQGMLGIKPDITTFGKAVGGGLPIGVIAGKSRYLDLIDGGQWSYGDASYPQSKQTLFAGTFFQHPLVMSAAWAVLNQIKECGTEPWERLEARTGRLTNDLNAFLEQRQAPIRLVSFKSLFNFLFAHDQRYSELLFYHLLERGVFTAETRVCFLSTAHTDEDVDHVIEAVKESVEELKDGGFLTDGECEHQIEARPATRDLEAPRNADVVTRPLTEAQKGLWIVTQMGGDASYAYNESITLRLKGPLDVKAMQKALDKVIERHESLRTTFSPDGEQQCIQSSSNVEVPLVDYSGMDEDGRAANLHQALVTEASTPFDLIIGPLLRVRVLKLADEEHVLNFTAHHIVVDGLSLAVMQRELAEFYSAECRGDRCRLPEAMQFSQYVDLQYRQTQSEESEAAEAYWLDRFAGPIEPLALPVDRQRPPVQCYTGARESATIDPSLQAELKLLGAREGCTLFMTLLAGFKALLHHLAGQKEFVIGVHSAGQMTVNGDGLVGFCINLLPLRSHLQPEDRTFSTFLKSVKRGLLDAYSHQSYPFAKLLKRLNLPRKPDRPPLVTAIFNLDRVGGEPEFSGLVVEPVQSPIVFSRFDLLWNLTYSDSALTLNGTYNAALFDARTVRAWFGLYETVLRTIVEHPDIRMAELMRALAAAGRQRELQEEITLEQANLRKLSNVERRAIRVVS